MVEVKSVKVDNWGVFFLQKLQNFFNKTDYCDLTLQFKDNSQLKVHRLVLSACTDFFNVLEMRYNVSDDILIMPKDLQADVVVPIVNFMYTGTLEFEVNMYSRLLKTAKDMNMTVLLKLLDAHKRTVGESLRSNQQTGAPVLLNKGASQRVSTYSRPSAPQRTYTTQRRPAVPVKTSTPRNAYQSKIIKQEKSSPPVPVGVSRASTSYIRKNLPEAVQLVAKYASSSASSTTIKGPSRFECSDDTHPEAFESSFDNISYESKPLITASQLTKAEKEPEPEVSFEKLKRSATGTVKRPYSSNSSLASPPEKKPNIQDVKEYTEAHRLRKEIVAQEAEEDNEYYADDFQNADDDDEEANESNTGDNTSSGSVIIKSEAGGSVNHAKIISEVLKKYPHLVKNTKNIKLKIMQKGNNPVTVSAVTKDPTTIATSKQQAASKQTKAITIQAKVPAKTTTTASSAAASKSASSVTKVSPQVTKSTATAAPAAATPPPSQPKKIDSRTMHALIAKGAENMTGPWLCLDCGVNGRPISIPSYKGFRRHLVNVHKQKIDPRICEHCGHRAQRRHDLHYHILIKHNIKPPNDLQYPKCAMCAFVALDPNALRKHKEEDHQALSSQQHCIYCNKTFSKEIQLYAHMRANHKERAQDDGVMDFSDDEQYEDDADKYVPNNPETTQTVAGTGSSDSKIKVLSNITLPSKAPFVIDQQGNNSVTLIQTSTINLEPSSEAEGLSNVASGIATSLAVLDTNAHIEEHFEESYDEEALHAAMGEIHGETLSPKKHEEHTEVVTKFITEEGSELQLTADQKAQLLEQLQGQTDLSENVVMVLDASFDHQATQEHVIANESTESMEMMEEGKGEEWQASATQGLETDEQSKNDDSMEATEDEEMAESAENISADDDSQEGQVEDSEQQVKSAEVETPSKLISALEGDWSEEDIDETKQPNKVKQIAGDGKSDAEQSAKSAKALGKQSKTLRKIVDDSYDSSSSASSNRSSGRQAHIESTKNDKSSDKNLSNLILDDWDSQQSGKYDDDEKVSEGDKLAEENLSSFDADDIETAPKEKSESDKKVSAADKRSKSNEPTGKTSESSDKNGSGAEKKQAQQKNDLKTLINDWGDEDDEAI